MHPKFLDLHVPRSPNSQISKFPDFQTPPAPAPAPPDELSDPNLTPLPTHSGIKYVARALEATLADSSSGPRAPSRSSVRSMALSKVDQPRRVIVCLGLLWRMLTWHASSTVMRCSLYLGGACADSFYIFWGWVSFISPFWAQEVFQQDPEP